MVLNQVAFDDKELECLQGCCVSNVKDGVNDEGEEVVYITFYNPVTDKHIQIEIGEHGLLFISAFY